MTTAPELKFDDVVARFDLDGVLIELVPASQRMTGGNGNARLTLSTGVGHSSRCERLAGNVHRPGRE